MFLFETEGQVHDVLYEVSAKVQNTRDVCKMLTDYLIYIPIYIPIIVLFALLPYNTCSERLNCLTFLWLCRVEQSLVPLALHKSVGS